jgi:dGTPase
MNSSTERNDLAGYACTSSTTRGRKHYEEHRDNRPAFERDRDRIIHCAAFRRLEYKTQVFVNHEGDYYRTRLTHSLEVAQIGRAIARKLHLNEELTEALALSHDLGHTPFGHTGEDVLNRLMQGFGGFEHNMQSFRVVDELEERYPGFNGLNLTWEVREGIIKHSSPYDSASDVMADFLPGTVTSVEGQIINYADEIAYNNHDIDDGLKSGFISLAMLEQVDLWHEVSSGVRRKYPDLEEKRLVLQTISALIGLLIGDICATTATNIEAFGICSPDDLRRVNRAVVHFNSDLTERNRHLKSFLFQNLYRHHKVEKMRVKAEVIISRLFETYLRWPNLLPPKYQTRFERFGLQRVVCDYIAGMTDRFALDEYNRLY